LQKREEQMNKKGEQESNYTRNERLQNAYKQLLIDKVIGKNEKSLNLKAQK